MLKRGPGFPGCESGAPVCVSLLLWCELPGIAVCFLCGCNASSMVPFLLAGQVVELDLKTVVPCCSGPKRPQDKVAVSDMKKDFESCLGAKVGSWEGWVETLPLPASSGTGFLTNLPEAEC